jgi:hypothetical protein
MRIQNGRSDIADIVYLNFLSRRKLLSPRLRNDILRKHGVIPEKPPSPTPMIEEAILEARRLAHENRLEGKDLDELDELEDDEDEAFLDQYRLVEEVVMMDYEGEIDNLLDRSE